MELAAYSKYHSHGGKAEGNEDASCSGGVLHYCQVHTTMRDLGQA